MAEIDVGLQSLRDAAAATRSAAELVRDTEFAERITDIASAMPGTRSAETSARLGAYWHVHVREWAAFMDARAGRLIDAADRLEDDEQAMEDEFGQPLARGPR